eukprot:TRINITY_DN5410_c1_g1_i2.p1 TRINITY_DN5410_c1_g1~~TRINITY_DN5410_c1_g1_i2.p1  ORF type:complete len:544 (-),score=79.23 TRINITY_DN5410_c1_g1_i2:163-1794(-)
MGVLAASTLDAPLSAGPLHGLPLASTSGRVRAAVLAGRSFGAACTPDTWGADAVAAAGGADAATVLTTAAAARAAHAVVTPALRLRFNAAAAFLGTAAPDAAAAASATDAAPPGDVSSADASSDPWRAATAKVFPSLGMDVPGTPGRTRVEYWDNLSKGDLYKVNIFHSVENDFEGVIFRALDKAAARAKHAQDSALQASLREPDDAANTVGMRNSNSQGNSAVAVDAGCGTGDWLPELSRRFSKVVGFDISSGLLRKAQSRVESGKITNVMLGPAVDLGAPCAEPADAGPPTKQASPTCGPLPPLVGESGADVVFSANSLISPDPVTRSRMLRRMAAMLRPSPNSTLVLVVPSAASARHVREEYHRLNGARSPFRYIPDYALSDPAEEESGIFRAHFVRTQFYDKERICGEVEAAGLKCEDVRAVPYKWDLAFTDPTVPSQAFQSLRPPLPHLLVVTAHPRAVRSIPSDALPKVATAGTATSDDEHVHALSREANATTDRGSDVSSSKQDSPTHVVKPEVRAAALKAMALLKNFEKGSRDFL